MRGSVRRVSVLRRLIIDLMHASMGIPFVSLRRRLDVSAVVEARAGLNGRPGWAAIFAKAFCLIARDEPVLRTMYIGWPWPHFYEIPRSTGMIAISRTEDGEDCVLPQRICAADEMPLADVDALIHYARTAPLKAVPSFRKLLRVSRLPLPLRRLLWAVCMANGRQRANFCGNFGITAVAAFGPGDLEALSPGPFLLSYGTVNPDGTIDVVIRWDHRVTDAALIARTLSRLQEALNGELATELLANWRESSSKPVHAVAI